MVLRATVERHSPQALFCQAVSTVATGGFEGVATSSAMTKLSPTSTKTEGSRNNVVLAFRRG
jgi:hypothetical protein